VADVGVEGGANLHATNITEKALDSKRFAPLNNRHIVQLEELDDDFDPLEVDCLESCAMLPSLCTGHRLWCLDTGVSMITVRCWRALRAEKILTDLLLLGHVDLEIINDSFLCCAFSPRGFLIHIFGDSLMLGTNLREARRRYVVINVGFRKAVLVCRCTTQIDSVEVGTTASLVYLLTSVDDRLQDGQRALQ